jgi:HAE1 family hydrophobic/amphiphilic exporter-1
MLGFSINVLSLLGLVLAIGIVVDDAIVVVEAVMHHIEQGLSPREATLKAMKEVSGPVVAIALILAAVFIPVAFIPGITGRFYQQFAITIAISVLLSAFNALTLSPALAAKMLKPTHGEKSWLTPFYDRFNAIFGRGTTRYVGFTSLLVRKLWRSVFLIGGIVALAALLASRVPTGFVPDEDQGFLLAGAHRCGDAQGRKGAGIRREDRGLQHHHGLQPGRGRLFLEHGFRLRTAEGVG